MPHRLQIQQPVGSISSFMSARRDRESQNARLRADGMIRARSLGIARRWSPMFLGTAIAVRLFSRQLRLRSVALANREDLKIDSDAVRLMILVSEE